MVEIFIREKKVMTEISELAKAFAKQDSIPYTHAFSHIFNEASCGGMMAFVEDGVDHKGNIKYRLANKSDFLQRLLDEKDLQESEQL